MRALEDAIVASPNDASRYAVYADALMADGDVRGELIALQLRLSSIKDPGEFAQLRSRERALLDTVAAATLGPLPMGIAVEWKWGFVHHVACGAFDAGSLSALLGRRVLRAVQSIRFSRNGTRLPELLEAMLAAQPRALRRLELMEGLVSDGAARRIVAQHPGLEHLRMFGDLVSPLLLELPALKSLELSRLMANDEVDRRLAAAPWSGLRRLTVSAFDLRVDCLLPVLAAPKLTQVRLALADFGPVLAALARRGDVSQLSELHLAGLVTDAQLAPLLERVHELGALKLTLPARGLSMETVTFLRQSLKVQLLGAVRAEEDPGALTMTRDEAVEYRQQQERAFAIRRSERDFD